MGIKVLLGHTSPETAWMIFDYPTGRRARCLKRVWIETAMKGPKKGQQRLVYQTSQPKYKLKRIGWKEGDPVPDKAWRRKKKSTYSSYVVMYLDEEGMMHSDYIDTNYSYPEALAKFIRRYRDALKADPDMALDLASTLNITATRKAEERRIQVGGKTQVLKPSITLEERDEYIALSTEVMEEIKWPDPDTAGEPEEEPDLGPLFEWQE